MQTDLFENRRFLCYLRHNTSSRLSASSSDLIQIAVHSRLITLSHKLQRRPAQHRCNIIHNWILQMLQSHKSTSTGVCVRNLLACLSDSCVRKIRNIEENRRDLLRKKQFHDAEGDYFSLDKYWIFKVAFKAWHGKFSKISQQNFHFAFYTTFIFLSRNAKLTIYQVLSVLHFATPVNTWSFLNGFYHS